MSGKSDEEGSAEGLGGGSRGTGKEVQTPNFYDLPSSLDPNSLHNRRRSLLIQEGETLRARCEPGDKIPKRRGQEMPMKTEVECARAHARIKEENDLMRMRAIRKQWIKEECYWALKKHKLADLVKNMGWVTPEGISDESENEYMGGVSPIISDETDTD